ncbi:hypothetical protein [Kitasatospora sp. NPDC002965]|uniref:hypothetical protein n=1 Tax=Kitasatospora sp. NPDC002965 TaxID=3154775 RepID=UPI0033B63AA3
MTATARDTTPVTKLDTAARQYPLYGPGVSSVLSAAVFHTDATDRDPNEIGEAAVALTRTLGNAPDGDGADPDGALVLAGWLVAHWVEIQLARHPLLAARDDERRTRPGTLHPASPTSPATLHHAVCRIIASVWERPGPDRVQACLTAHRAAQTWTAEVHEAGLHQVVQTLATAGNASRTTLGGRLARDHATVYTHQSAPDLGQALTRITTEPTWWLSRRSVAR